MLVRYTKIYFVSSIIIASSLVGCSTFIPAHKYSDKRQHEETSINLTHKKDIEIKEFAPILAIAAPIAVNFALKRFSSNLKDEGERYVADYTAAISDDTFFDEEGEINLDTISISRKVALEAGSKEKSMAFSIELSIIPSRDGAVFTFRPETYFACFSKAKVPKKKWYWFWLDEKAKIDLDVNLSILATWVDKNSIGHSTLVGELSLPLRSIELDGENCSKRDANELNISQMVGWFPAIPKSVVMTEDGKVKKGLGTYELKVKVREYDDFGNRIMKLSEFVETNRESWGKTISDLVVP